MLDKIVKKAIFYLLILSHTQLYTQEFAGGVTIGLSASQVSGDNLAGYNKAGLLIGAFANRKITKLLTVQMEINYIQKGSNNPNINDLQNSNYNTPDISLSYVEVPIIFNFQQNENLQLESGIYIANLIDGFYNDYIGKLNNYGNNPFTKNDSGVLIGLNYLLFNKLSLNTRISQSILPIGSEDDSRSVYNSSKKGKYNSVLSFAIQYKI